MDFQHAYAQRFAASSDSLIIYVSIDCGTNWEQVFGISEDGNGSFATHELTNASFTPQVEDDWCGAGFGADCYSLDLSDFAGNPDVRIMFEIVNGFGNNFFLDNLNFTVITDLAERLDNEGYFEVYPNPVTDELNIVGLGQGLLYEIINTGGQVVLSGTLSGNNGEVMSAKLKMDGLTGGIYLVRVYNNTKSAIKKVVLK